MKKLLGLLLLAIAVTCAQAQTTTVIGQYGGLQTVPLQTQLTAFYTTNTAAIAAKEAAITAGTSLQYWNGAKAWTTFPTTLSSFTNNLTGITASQLVGTDITTVGTIATGTWHGTAVADAYIASAATWNAKEPAITAGTALQYWTGLKTWATLPTSTPLATEYTATAAQTSFTLAFTPVGDVGFVRNGLAISKTFFTVSGTTVTYSGETLVAADVISIREIHN